MFEFFSRYIFLSFVLRRDYYVVLLKRNGIKFVRAMIVTNRCGIVGLAIDL